MKNKKIICIIWIILCGLVFTCNAEEIRVITEEVFPAQYLDKETGRVTGVTAEMVRTLLNRLHLRDNITIYPWARAYQMALKETNIAIFEMTRTQEREYLFKWVGPINRVDWGFYALRDAKIRIDDLQQAKTIGGICAYRGDARGQHLINNGFTNLVEVVEPIQCVKMLHSNRVSLWIASEMGLSTFLNKINMKRSDLRLVYPVDIKYLYIAFSKDVSDDIVKMWQEALDGMKKDGTFQAHYQGKYPEEVIKDLINR